MILSLERIKQSKQHLFTFAYSCILLLRATTPLLPRSFLHFYVSLFWRKTSIKPMSLSGYYTTEDFKNLINDVWCFLCTSTPFLRHILNFSNIALLCYLVQEYEKNSTVSFFPVSNSIKHPHLVNCILLILNFLLL